MHLLLYVKSDFHVFYCDFVKPPLWSAMMRHVILRENPSEKQVNPIFGNLVYEMKLYLSHEISLVCICHNRHEIDSNSANNACSSVVISKYL